jgi:hypothetical protein
MLAPGWVAQLASGSALLHFAAGGYTSLTELRSSLFTFLPHPVVWKPWRRAERAARSIRDMEVADRATLVDSQ